MSSSERPAVLFVLECAGCGERDELGLGWRAYLDVDDEVCIYGVVCARRDLDDD